MHKDYYISLSTIKSTVIGRSIRLTHRLRLFVHIQYVLQRWVHLLGISIHDFDQNVSGVITHRTTLCKSKYKVLLNIIGIVEYYISLQELNITNLP